MEQNSDHTSKSTQSQPVVAEMDGIFQQSKEPKSQKNKLSKIFTQHRFIIRDYFGEIGNNLIKNKNDNSQSLQQYYSIKIEDIKAKINATQIQLKQLEQKQSLYEKELQIQTERANQYQIKISLLQVQIQNLYLQFGDYEQKLAELQEAEEIPQIVSKKLKIRKYINQIQGQRTILNIKIKSLNLSIKGKKKKIETLQAEKSKCQEDKNQLKEILESNKKCLYKKLKTYLK